MKRLILSLLTLIVVSSCGVRRSSISRVFERHATPIHLIAATHGTNAQALYSFEVSTSGMRQLSATQTAAPTALTQDEGVCYVTHATSTQAGVSALRFDRVKGNFELINRAPTLGARPEAVTLHGSHLVVSNSGSGSITLFERSGDGSLSRPLWRIELTEGSPTGVMPSHLCFTPNGHHLYLLDTGQQQIWQFDTHESTPPLTIAPSTLPPLASKGDAPVALAMHSSGKVLVLLQRSGDLIPFTIDRTGALTQSTPFESRSSGTAAMLALAPTNDLCYVTQGNTLLIYRVDNHGTITPLSSIATLRQPSAIAVSQNGEWVAVASRIEGAVMLYRRTESGGLRPLSKRISLGNISALCFM